jgi:hypothetical protein
VRGFCISVSRPTVASRQRCVAVVKQPTLARAAATPCLCEVAALRMAGVCGLSLALTHVYTQGAARPPEKSHSNTIEGSYAWVGQTF